MWEQSSKQPLGDEHYHKFLFTIKNYKDFQSNDTMKVELWGGVIQLSLGKKSYFIRFEWGLLQTFFHNLLKKFFFLTRQKWRDFLRPE